MSQRRMIHAQIWHSEQVGKLSPLARVLYIGMVTLADDEGRLKGHPAYLRAQVFPYDDILNADVEKAREEIIEAGLIEIYIVDQSQYIQHPNWEKYQTLRADRIQASRLPDPPNAVTAFKTLKEVDGATEPLRVIIAKRDKGCRYCGEPFKSNTPTKFIIEHVIPVKQGGKTNKENCVLACQSCNTIKGNRTPEEAKMPLLPIPLNTLNEDSGEPPQIAAESRLSKDKISKVKKRKDNLRRKSTAIKETTKTDGATINQLLELFKPINPSYARLYANTTQRKALDRLTVLNGVERMTVIIKDVLPITNRKKYYPTITTPMQLEDRLATLASKIEQDRDMSHKGKQIIE